MEYTFHYSHRSGTDYLVSVERLVAADSEKVGWYFRWRNTASGSPWVDWSPLGIPANAILDDATARAKELVSRLYQTGAHRVATRPDQKASGEG